MMLLWILPVCFQGDGETSRTAWMRYLDAMLATQDKGLVAEVRTKEDKWNLTPPFWAGQEPSKRWLTGPYNRLLKFCQQSPEERRFNRAHDGILKHMWREGIPRTHNTYTTILWGVVRVDDNAPRAWRVWEQMVADGIVPQLRIYEYMAEAVGRTVSCNMEWGVQQGSMVVKIQHDCNTPA